MKEHIKILNKFKESPYEVLGNRKDFEKLIAAINKSIEVMHAENSRKRDRDWSWL